MKLPYWKQVKLSLLQKNICVFNFVFLKFVQPYFQKDSILNDRYQKVAITVSEVWLLKLFGKYQVPPD